MKKATTIFEAGSHRWVAVARDPDRQSSLIDTNEFVVQSGDDALLTDPGGMEIFPAVFSAIGDVMDPRRVSKIFSSHQDPDVISSLALWIAFNPDIRCHVSGLWKNFIPHFGGDETTIVGIPDQGADLAVGTLALRAVPAHYLHSSGNFHLYDPSARILFSGDVGAALLPDSESDLFVRDFDRHIRFAAPVSPPRHNRAIGS